jgi:hypothetical protein
MKDFFLAIESLFEDFLFLPFDFLRTNIQPDSWLAANGVNFLFLTIGFVAFFYWMKQLKVFNEDTSDTEDNYLI